MLLAVVLPPACRASCGNPSVVHRRAIGECLEGACVFLRSGAVDTAPDRLPGGNSRRWLLRRQGSAATVCVMERQKNPALARAMRALWARVRAGKRPAPAGRGHWPKGRRQHELTSSQAAALAAAKHAMFTRHEPGKISRRKLAEFVGVESKTVTRWFSGQHVPGPASARRIVLWIRQLP